MVRNQDALVVGVAVASGLILNVDQASIIITLGLIAEEFASGLSGSQWILSAYLLPVASLVVLGGTISDRYPVLRVLTSGLALFTLGSLFSSLCQSHGQLIVARIVCGIGAAFVFPASLALIRKGLSEADSRRAFGLWFGAAIGGSALGPVINGYLLDQTNWRIVFIVSTILSIILLVSTIVIPINIPSVYSSTSVSVLSTVLVTGSLTSAVFGLIYAGQYGWLNNRTLIPTGISIGIIGITLFTKRYFVKVLPKGDNDTRGSVPFVGIMLLSILPVVGVVVLLVLYFGTVRDLSAFQTGLAITPFGLTAALLAPVVPRLIARHGFVHLLLAGVGTQLVGLALLSQITPTSSYWLPGIALLCLGASMAIFPPLTLGRASQYVPPHASGYLSGIHSAAIQVGQLLSIALIGSIASSKISTSLRDAYVADGRWEVSDEGYEALKAGERWVPSQVDPVEIGIFDDLADLGFANGFDATVKVAVVISVGFVILGVISARKVGCYLNRISVDPTA